MTFFMCFTFLYVKFFFFYFYINVLVTHQEIGYGSWAGI